MPQPTLSQVHVNKPLTDMSLAFIQEDRNYVADRVFSKLPVDKKSDVYFTYERDNWFRDEMKKRAPGAESAGGGFPITTDNYSADVWALHKDIADQIRANSDEPIDMDRDATRWLTQQGQIRKEKEWSSQFFTTSVWTGSSTGSDITPGTKWDAATGDPVGDVQLQIDSMGQKTGFRANKMVVTAETHRALRNNEDIKDRIKYVMKVTVPDVTPELLAALFGVEEYLVARATENTAKEGATRAMSYILGSDQAALYYVPPSPGIMVPAAGYTFAWSGLLGANAAGTTISTFRMEWLKSDRVEIESAFDQKLVASDLGIFFTDVLT